MKESKLERHKPFLYGMADLGPASIDVFIKVYLLLFFNVIMGLSPSLTSLAIGLGVLWDALIDPWIGVYSDSYYHKNGHRKFVIYAATAVIVTLFFFMWRLPRMPELPTFILLFLISSFLNSALSLYSVPYIAIANDLEHDNEERKKWTGWRLAFLNLGAFFGLAVPGYILTTAESSAEPAQAYQTSSLVLCGIMCFVSFTSIYLVYRNRRFTVSDVPAEKRKRLIELIQDRT
ncbi:MAG: MFS transporter, partial [Pseudobdellovibrio sp.]